MSDARLTPALRLRRRLVRHLPAGSPLGNLARRLATAAAAGWTAVAAPYHARRDEAEFARLAHGPGIGRRAEGREVVMLVVAPVRDDARVRRSAEAIVAAGFAVTLIWPEMPSTVGAPIDWGPGVAFQPLAPHARAFADRFPGVYGRLMLDAALTHRPFAYHAHDLTAAIVALTAAEATGAHAVVDFHEWLSESVRFSPVGGRYVPISARLRAARKRFEHRVLAEASAVVTVTPSIAAEIEAETAAPPRIQVVRNIPDFAARPTRRYPSLRAALAVGADQTLVLYQGGLGPTRDLEPVIAALADAPTVILAIRGPESDRYGPGYRSIAAKAGAAARLHILPPVPATDVVAAAEGADAGLFTVANLCRSFVHALPNKVFEYLAAGLPVLTIANPDVSRLVVDHGVGLAFNPSEPGSIAAALRRMAEPDARAAMRARITPLLDSLDAAAEWGKLGAIYRDLQAGRTPAPPHGRAGS